ncbi:MAG TPA: hypothetical protein VK061_05095 [Bacillota bacterium]|nr:hypothetical protein [Bacillota bacterium]
MVIPFIFLIYFAQQEESFVRWIFYLAAIPTIASVIIQGERYFERIRTGSREED